MKKFKDLNLTYLRLKSEIERLTTMCIEETAELNSVATRLGETKKEYEALKLLLVSDSHENKIEIKNYNKDFVDQLKEKDKKLRELDRQLKKEKSIHKILRIRLDKETIGLQVLTDELEKIESQLSNKSTTLVKIQQNLDNKTKDMDIKTRQWEKILKIKEKEYNEVNQRLLDTRNEIDSTKQIHKVAMEKIEKQKMVLGLRESRLKDKEIKINSDMKTLLSAKQYTNAKRIIKH